MADYCWIDDVGGGPDADFRWTLDGLADLAPSSGVDFDGTCGDGGCLEQSGSRKRMRNDSCTGPKSKACREKMRRDRLNDRFLELSAVLEPGKPPKSDKAGILGDAARALVQLRNEAGELKEVNKKLHDAIKDLKEEKNELRDEKLKLKTEKERLEQQVKMLSLPAGGFFPHPAAYHAAAAAAAAASFASQNQASTNKTAAFPYPGLPAWQWIPPGQWLPPAARDTAQDQKHVSPTA